MSTWEERTKEAALLAAKESMDTERARCLWVLDDLIRQTEEQLKRKLLIESERHATEVKMRIARSIVAHARRGIVMGVRPPSNQKGTQ